MQMVTVPLYDAFVSFKELITAHSKSFIHHLDGSVVPIKPVIFVCGVHGNHWYFSSNEDKVPGI
jgi:hypothetical protein